MVELKPGRVEKMSAQMIDSLSQIGMLDLCFIPCAIDLVADDRMMDVSEVDPDLVGAAGFEV
jgi:hypothetical protein